MGEQETLRTDVDRPEIPNADRPAAGRRDEGGDAACWAHRVCPECGRLNEAEHPLVCEACGVAFES